MNLIKKAAPRRLARAILTLAARRGNRSVKPVQSDQLCNPDHNEDTSCWPGNGSRHTQPSKRTTITIETERLVVLRSTPSVSKLCTDRDLDSFSKRVLTPTKTGGMEKS